MHSSTVRSARFKPVPAELTVVGTDPEPALACLEDPEVAAANVRAWAAVLRHNSVSNQRAALTALYGRARRAQ